MNIYMGSTWLTSQHELGVRSRRLISIHDDPQDACLDAIDSSMRCHLQEFRLRWRFLGLKY